jgi:hypothetical protein
VPNYFFFRLVNMGFSTFKRLLGNYERGRKSKVHIRPQAKVGHVRHISAFQSFSGFIIALRNIPEKFRKKSSGNVIIYQYCYCIVIMFFKYNYFLCLIFSIICIPRSTEVLSGSKAKVGHVRHISAFRSFSGFIIYIITKH